MTSSKTCLETNTEMATAQESPLFTQPPQEYILDNTEHDESNATVTNSYRQAVVEQRP